MRSHANLLLPPGNVEITMSFFRLSLQCPSDLLISQTIWYLKFQVDPDGSHAKDIIVQNIPRCLAFDVKRKFGFLVPNLVQE